MCVEHWGPKQLPCDLSLQRCTVSVCAEQMLERECGVLGKSGVIVKLIFKIRVSVLIWKVAHGGWWDGSKGTGIFEHCDLKSQVVLNLLHGHRCHSPKPRSEEGARTLLFSSCLSGGHQRMWKYLEVFAVGGVGRLVSWEYNIQVYPFPHLPLPFCESSGATMLMLLIDMAEFPSLICLQMKMSLSRGDAYKSPVIYASFWEDSGPASQETLPVFFSTPVFFSVHCLWTFMSYFFPHAELLVDTTTTLFTLHSTQCSSL